MSFQINLTKHPHENRFLMCWYEVKFKGEKLRFRSDAFVTEQEEEKLEQLHCNCKTKQELITKCLVILKPYIAKIEEALENWLLLTPEEQEEQDHIENTKNDE